MNEKSFFKNTDKYIAVDADSVNIELRRIIINASEKTGVNVLFVADRHLKDVSDARIRGANVAAAHVNTDFDSADNFIAERADEILFCISHDKGLAERLHEKGIQTIDKQGNILDMTNISEVQNGKITAKSKEKFADSMYTLIKKTRESKE